MADLLRQKPAFQGEVVDSGQVHHPEIYDKGVLMKNGKLIVILCLIVIFIVIALIVLLTTTNQDNSLEFTVIDKISNAWVWDLTVTLQNRIIRGFYQSDRGAVPFQFTNLSPGSCDLKFSAPAYEELTLPVTIKRGRNVLADPIVMTGYEIPGICNFFVFFNQEGNDIAMELRPVDVNNTGIKNHPCLDLWIGCKIYAETAQGGYLQAPVKGTSRDTGALLFKGKVPWEWDASPETFYRYKARIKGNRIEKHLSPYRVYQYLIIVPDPRKVTTADLDKEITPLLNLENPAELKKRLEGLKQDRFSYFINTRSDIPALK